MRKDLNYFMIITWNLLSMLASLSICCFSRNKLLFCFLKLLKLENETKTFWLKCLWNEMFAILFLFDNLNYRIFLYLSSMLILYLGGRKALYFILNIGYYSIFIIQNVSKDWGRITIYLQRSRTENTWFMHFLNQDSVKYYSNSLLHHINLYFNLTLRHKTTCTLDNEM